MKPKAITERIKEIRTLYQQLEAIGLHEGIDAIDEFRKEANVFVKTGKSSTGVISVPSVQRALVYEFSSNPRVPCTVVLKAL